MDYLPFMVDTSEVELFDPIFELVTTFDSSKQKELFPYKIAAMLSTSLAHLRLLHPFVGSHMVRVS